MKPVAKMTRLEFAAYVGATEQCLSLEFIFRAPQAGKPLSIEGFLIPFLLSRQS